MGYLKLKKINSLHKISSLKEDCEIECKLANGESGKGKLPKSFWETYSSFANTSGGIIFLGLGENKGDFSIVGIKNPNNVKQELFDALQNPQKVNVNLLNNNNITVHRIDDKNIISIEVPKACWSQKPVYISGNPACTYKRLNEGDYKCSEQEIKHMMAESSNDPHDSMLLKGYSLDDLNAESLGAYRQLISSRKPSHTLNTLGTIDFLMSIGAWKKDRASKEDGLTVAGLLMFGKLSSIQEVLPHYALDYVERPRSITENRWNYRIYTDGTWSGNLFDFYNKVYSRLTEDIKIPFALEEGQRKENSSISIVLREALANTLCHADYRSNKSILIVKRPDMFGFRNPGGMRVSLENAKDGGLSLCRNPKIHQMLLHIGACERAGTGIPTIYSKWGEEGYRTPMLHEDTANDTTLLELRLASLLPTDIMTELEKSIPDFTELTQLEKTILVTAKLEEHVTHKRICEISSEHSRDITETLQKLVSKNLLKKTGHKSYLLPDTNYTSANDYYNSKSSTPGVSSGRKDQSSGHKDQSSGHKNLDLPVISDLNKIPESQKASLEKMCTLSRSKDRLSKKEMIPIILSICKGHYISLSCIAELLNRNTDTIRKSYLTDMKDEGLLKLAFPAEPNDPRQGYATVE